MNQETLKEHLSYCPETGEFTWIKSPSSFIKVGSKAGNVNNQNPYVYIKISGVVYKAHRLAWLYTFGKFPEKFIDHINGIKRDNRLCNLRKATSSQNSQNLVKPTAKNTSGFLGVSYSKRAKKFIAMIQHSGKNRYIGSFDTAELASDAYLGEKRKHHEFCTI